MLNYYIDQDGVLNIYERCAYLGDNPKWLIPNTNYFRKVEPNKKIIQVFKRLNDEMVYKKSNPKEYPLHVDNLYVLTTLRSNSDIFFEHLEGKKLWMKDHCPNFDLQKGFKIAFDSKSKTAEAIKGSKLTLKDVLIDDFNPNLIDWRDAGGLAIKYLNGINSRLSFDGLHIEENMDIDKIQKFLSTIATTMHNK